MDNHPLDTQDMARAIYDFPDQLAEAMEICKNFTVQQSGTEVKNIVMAGMGGSAIGGDVCKAFLAQEITVPMIISRNYSLPNWVNENTLVICSSYSGNTEETLSACAAAQSKNTQICGISTGGRLTEILKEQGCDLVTIPAGLQPRAALAFSIVPMLFILKAHGLIGDTIFDEIAQTTELLRAKREGYTRENERNPTYALAKKIYKTLPVIYGSSDNTAIAALRWKGQFCENANMLAYHNELPELDHNEIVGWDNNPELYKNISVLWLTDEDDHERVQLRQEITNRIIGMKNVNQHTVAVTGSSKQVRMLHMIHFGDWVSYWCAILHGTDPSPVAAIEELKAEISSK